MALQRAYIDPSGVEHPEAYWRIVQQAGDFISNEQRVWINVYHNAAARFAGKAPLYPISPYLVTFPTTPADVAQLGVLYIKIKQRAEFATATDV